MTDYDDDTDYPVGYGKPPKDTQFKPGQSGNPAGRPKGSRNLKTVLLDVLSEEITIRENGRPLVISKLEALCRSLAADALAGDKQTRKMLIDVLKRYSGPFGR